MKHSLKGSKVEKIVILFEEGEDPYTCLELLGRNEIKWLSEERADEFSPRSSIGERAFCIRTRNGYIVYERVDDLYVVLTCNEEVEEIVKWKWVKKRIGEKNELFDLNDYAERLTNVTLEKVNETTDDLIIDAILSFARSVEYRINKADLKQAIRMYYGKEDVAEVVRCKDCKWASRKSECRDCGDKDEPCVYCCYLSACVQKDNFCYHGKRRK